MGSEDGIEVLKYSGFVAQLRVSNPTSSQHKGYLALQIRAKHYHVSVNLALKLVTCKHSMIWSTNS